MATHSSTLAWKILWMEEPGRLPSMGSQIVRCNWATSLYILMGRKWYFITVLISFLKWLVMSTSFCVIVVLCNIFSRKTFINIFTHSVSRLFCCFCIPFSSVTQSCPTLCDSMNHSMPGLPVHHQLPEFIQTHVHRVSDAIQPSHPLSSPSPPALNPSQNQSLFQWVNSSQEVAKVLEFQL